MNVLRPGKETLCLCCVVFVFVPGRDCDLCLLVRASANQLSISRHW